MQKNILCFFLILLAIHASAQERKYNYRPVGRELVCKNGVNKYTRALYGSHTDFRLETSDRPVFATFKRKECRNLQLHLNLNGEKIAMDSAFFDCEARYMGGRRTYVLTRDTMRIEMYVMASFTHEGAVFRFVSSGLPREAQFVAVLSNARSSKFNRNGDLGVDDLTKFDAAEGAPLSTATWAADGTSFLLLADNSSVKAHTADNAQAFAEAQKIFDSEEQQRQSIMSQVEINTPDPLFNTLGSVLMAAADGLWDGLTWQHGCIGWRTPLAGWRGCYVGDAVGWLDRSYRHFAAYAKSQVTDVEPVLPHPTQDPKNNMARAEKRWGTQMYSNGYICRYPQRNNVMHHYDMNLNYIDGLLWHLSYDADIKQLREFWPVLKRHLAWEKRNFDPDNDHLYDAYCCIWASDALYYNGGAVTHSSAYNYRGNKLAARIAEILGEDPAPYRHEAESILKAMNERLWMPERGHWAEFQDLMGMKRLHPSAALWTIYTPIDCGACTPEQAYQATRYVDRDIPHIKVGDVGFTLSTTSWMPYAWSINNVAHEEVANMALAYFQAGRTDVGFTLLKSDLTDEMLMGQSPGNFGQISFYDRERSEAYRDFGDNVGITSRAIINGLFGILPDALHGRCVIKPAFPEEWKEASIRTPYLTYSFKREGDKDIYDIEHHFRQPLQIIVQANAGGGALLEVKGTSEGRQTIVVDRTKLPPPNVFPEIKAAKADVNSPEYIEKMGLGDITPETMAEHSYIDMSDIYNSNVDDIFRNEYLSPRPPYTTLQIPVNGIGEWCHPTQTAEIEDNGLRNAIVTDKKGRGIFDTKHGLRFMLPKNGHNIVYTSQWDNYPNSVEIPMKSKKNGYSAAYLMMAGSTNNMQSRIDNALVVAVYADGTTDTLHIENPINWPTINQEYVFDNKAFWSAPVMPLRFRLDNGMVAREINHPSVLPAELKAEREAKQLGNVYGYEIHHGAGVILKMPLNPKKRLRSLRLETLSNEIVAGIMAVTLERKR